MIELSAYPKTGAHNEIIEYWLDVLDQSLIPRLYQQTQQAYE